MDTKITLRERAQLWREKQGTTTLPEDDLVQDMIYVLQGIDGKHIKFQERPDAASRPVLSGLPGYELQDDEFEGRILVVQDQGQTVSLPTQELIYKLAELGWLFRKVQTALQNAESQPIGMVKQSLFHAFQNQFTEYFRLVAVLESRIGNKPAIALSSESPQELPSAIDPQSGLTLKRFAVWTDDMRLRFRMMGVLTNSCQRASGGALVSLIHDYTANGDPFIRQFTKHLLEQVSRPFFQCLSKWIYEGELLDENEDEFFVQLSASPELRNSQYGGTTGKNRLAKSGRGLGSEFAIGGLEGENRQPETYKLWAEKFSFRVDMLPKFLDETYGKKIFSTGKSLNFIRHNCDNETWLSTKTQMLNLDLYLKYSDISALEKSIDTAYSVASQNLFDIFISKYQLLDHLRILKDYVMLDRGDFVTYLLEWLGPSLSRPANTLYRHNLTATLEAAINNSAICADTPQELLRRLDTSMLEFSRGEIGWDVFTLQYKVDSPIDTILDPPSIEQYLLIFNQLWKIKHVEYAVKSAWRQILVKGKGFSEIEEIAGDIHRARTALSEMIYFVNQLQYFAHLEVIRSNWLELESFVKRKEGDLDSFIDAHRSYLDRLVNKILLLVSNKKDPEEILTLVRDNFNHILKFREAVDSLYSFAEPMAKKVKKSKKTEKVSKSVTTRRGRFVPTPVLSESSDDNGDDDKEQQGSTTFDQEKLESIRANLVHYGTAFHDTTESIVRSLASHKDMDLRFLSVRFNFSLFYQVAKRKA